MTGERLKATVTLQSGLNAVSGDAIGITGSVAEVNGINEASYTISNGVVSFKEANINEGATLTFITNATTVTLSVYHQ